MDVGVRELKQHLSKYLERAASGEVIRITERGVARAILGPIPETSRVAEGVAEGWVTPAEDVGVAEVRPAKSRRRISDVLDEDRGR